MKLSELMKDVTPKPDYEGFVGNDDFVLAIDTAAPGATGSAVGDYAVVQIGVNKAEGSVDSETKDNTYIRTGKMTNKTGAQRKFSVEGALYSGDAFQDFCLSHAIQFGRGAAVVRPYVYFNMLTGKGEKGKVTIIPSDTQTGDAGENATFKVEMTSTEAPVEYAYTTTTTTGS